MIGHRLLQIQQDLFRLLDGNQIQTAVRSRGAVMIWTDTALYAMQFIGAPLTFGFKQMVLTVARRY